MGIMLEIVEGEIRVLKDKHEEKFQTEVEIKKEVENAKRELNIKGVLRKILIYMKWELQKLK